MTGKPTNKAFLRGFGGPQRGLCNAVALLVMAGGGTARLRCNLEMGHGGRHEFSQDDLWSSKNGQEMSSSTHIRWGTMEQLMEERA